MTNEQIHAEVERLNKLNLKKDTDGIVINAIKRVNKAEGNKSLPFHEIRTIMKQYRVWRQTI